MIPLGLFLLDFADNARRGVVWDSLWMCQLANLLMGLGVLLERPYVVRMGVLWIVAGTPLWLRELTLDPTIAPVSYLSHLGGLAFAIYWLRQGKQNGAPVWLEAWLFFVAVRLACGWLTPAALNINASHSARDVVGLAFWQYWLVTTLVGAACLYLVDVGLRALTSSAPQ
ncbi:MAG: hypothetical protein AB7S38_08430 [Vulcanimicrobiota bacterium]